MTKPHQTKWVAFVKGASNGIGEAKVKALVKDESIAYALRLSYMPIAMLVMFTALATMCAVRRSELGIVSASSCGKENLCTLNLIGFRHFHHFFVSNKWLIERSLVIEAVECV